jgi:hypothetical protein
MDEKGNHLNPMLRAPTWEEKVPSEITKNEMEVLGIVIFQVLALETMGFKSRLKE